MENIFRRLKSIIVGTPLWVIGFPAAALWLRRMWFRKPINAPAAHLLQGVDEYWNGEYPVIDPADLVLPVAKGV